jgi:hypothetical protein
LWRLDDGQLSLRQCAIFPHPPRQERLGAVFDPLIEERGNFTPKICCMIQARKLIAFE